MAVSHQDAGFIRVYLGYLWGICGVSVGLFSFFRIFLRLCKKSNNCVTRNIDKMVHVGVGNETVGDFQDIAGGKRGDVADIKKKSPFFMKKRGE